MYPINNASPQRVAIGAVVQISDGAVQTAGVSVKVLPQSTTASAGGGTIAYEEGIVHYLPTQAETNYASFILIAYKTGCIPATVTVVTSASGTAGHAGLDWGVVINKTTTHNLSATTIKTATDVEADTADIQTRIPAALVGGRIDANMGAISSDATAADNAEAFFDGTGYAGTNNVIPTVTTLTNLPAITDNWLTATGIAADAITAAKIADGAIDAATFAAGAINAAAIAADAIGASELAADAVAEIADAVWDEILSGHVVSGSTGEALGAAGAAGDPWITALPGAYSAGQAGHIVGTNLNATVSSRASQTSVDTIDDFLDTEVAAIKAVTDALPNAGALTTIQADLDNIQTRIPAALVGGNMPADVIAISGSTAAADNLEESTEVIGTGTCTTGGSTTSVVASAVSPASAVNDQFNGRVMIFKGNTTAALAGQATTISDYDHASLTFTVVALTTAPASGDLFTIL